MFELFYIKFLKLRFLDAMPFLRKVYSPLEEIKDYYLNQ